MRPQPFPQAPTEQSLEEQGEGDDGLPKEDTDSRSGTNLLPGSGDRGSGCRQGNNGQRLQSRHSSRNWAHTRQGLLGLFMVLLVTALLCWQQADGPSYGGGAGRRGVGSSSSFESRKGPVPGNLGPTEVPCYEHASAGNKLTSNTQKRFLPQIYFKKWQLLKMLYKFT